MLWMCFVLPPLKRSYLNPPENDIDLVFNAPNVAVPGCYPDFKYQGMSTVKQKAKCHFLA